MLEEGFFEGDFGLKTALNILDGTSLKGVDVHTFKEQPVGKRVQAPKAESHKPRKRAPRKGALMFTAVQYPLY